MEVDQIIEVLVTAVNPGFVKVDYEGRPATLQATELTWKPRALDTLGICKSRTKNSRKSYCYLRERLQHFVKASFTWW